MSLAGKQSNVDAVYDVSFVSNAEMLRGHSLCAVLTDNLLAIDLHLDSSCSHSAHHFGPSRALGRVCVCVCVSLSRQLSNEKTFDPDIQRTFSSDPVYVRFEGQGHKSKFTVTGSIMFLSRYVSKTSFD